MRKAILLLTTGFCVLGTSGCDQTWESSQPVSAEAAQKISDLKIPVPPSARSVRFRLSGGTQNWDFHAVYDVPAGQIQRIIQKELVDRQNPTQPVPEHLDPKPLPAKRSWLKKWAAPSWWTPEDIVEGYYVESPSGGENGPRFWVDTQNSRIYTSMHWN